jgi:predicted O-methyltransferase YrrM
MQDIKIKNILKQAIYPSRFRVMFKKVFKRFFDDSGGISTKENLEWLQVSCLNFEEYATNINKSLWDEAKVFAASLKSSSRQILSSIPHDLGGGGIYPLLYFVTRLVKPGVVVETGVAAGFSSSSFLAAIKLNGFGRLYSSDFPYFRIPNPEQYIGVVVDDSLKSNWELFIEGDEINLPAILGKINRVDVFHYDSDKSYSGRALVMSSIRKYLHKDSIVLMDDIQDNAFFYDYIKMARPAKWHIFEFEGKYIGIIGSLKKSNM